jgi:hypothetical protein
MFRASSHSYSPYSYLPASGPVVTIKPSSPVCPECHSSLNRVPRRFIDRLLSVVYPVHRYHCRSFSCNWEGNLRCSPELIRWEALDSRAVASSPSDYRAEVLPTAAATTKPRPPVPAARAGMTDATVETPRRESDTLPMAHTSPTKTKKPDARAEPRDATTATRRARKRGKAAPR